MQKFVQFEKAGRREKKSVIQLAKESNISDTAICNIVNKKAYRYVADTENDQHELDRQLNQEKIEDCKTRLESKAEKLDNGCWLWPGYTNAHGYGNAGFRNKTQYVHVLAWMLWKNNGVKPSSGTLVRHKCKGHRNCFNPKHLEEGTATDNARDRYRDGTMIRGEAHWWHSTNR
jgi:hypothetical protein